MKAHLNNKIIIVNLCWKWRKRLVQVCTTGMISKLTNKKQLGNFCCLLTAFKGLFTKFPLQIRKIEIIFLVVLVQKPYWDKPEQAPRWRDVRGSCLWLAGYACMYRTFSQQNFDGCRKFSRQSFHGFHLIFSSCIAPHSGTNPECFLFSRRLFYPFLSFTWWDRMGDWGCVRP